LNPLNGQKLVGLRLSGLPCAMGPGAEINAWWSDGETTEAHRQWGRGCVLYRAGDTSPFIVLGIDGRPAFHQCQFSRDGNFLAWGTTEGTIQLCHLPTIHERLRSIGLAW
jgi:hypothetical protein